MSPYLRTALGVTLGLAASMVVLAVYQHGGGPADSGPGPLLSDCDGRLQHLVIHYVEEAADTVVPTYRDFLGAALGRRDGLGRLPAAGGVRRSRLADRADRVPALARRRGSCDDHVVARPLAGVGAVARRPDVAPGPAGRRRGRRVACPRGRPTDCRRSGCRARPERDGTDQRPVLRRRRLHGRRRDGLRASGRIAAEPATHGGHARGTRRPAGEPACSAA